MWAHHLSAVHIHTGTPLKDCKWVLHMSTINLWIYTLTSLSKTLTCIMLSDNKAPYILPIPKYSNVGLQLELNWMAWCKTDLSEFFLWNSFSFKSAWIFHVLFNLVQNILLYFFWLKCSCSALLCPLCTFQYFVLVFLRNKVQTSQKNTGEWMFYYLTEKHTQKFRLFNFEGTKNWLEKVL